MSFERQAIFSHLLAAIAVILYGCHDPTPEHRGQPVRQLEGVDNESFLPQLAVQGQWVTQPDGSVVILRGLNMMSKDARTPEQLGFNERHAELMARHGFSVVRLGVIWENVQPYYTTPASKFPKYEDAYLESVSRTISMLARHKIYTLLDFHQDGYSTNWGIGAPLWAVMNNGTNRPQKPFPLNQLCQFGLVQTDGCKAWDYFWDNSTTRFDTTTSLRQHYVHYVRYAVDKYFSKLKGNIFGYEPMNEPGPGSKWPGLAHLKDGSPEFDKILGGFYEEIIPVIQEFHSGAIVWYQPTAQFGLGSRTWLPKLQFSNIGFNFHNYDPLNFTQIIQNAVDVQRSSSVPLLNSEFGGAPKSYENIQKVLDLNDRFMLSWMYWAYNNNARYPLGGVSEKKPPSDPREQAIVVDLTGSLDVDGHNENVDKALLQTLTRVYPRIIAGTPLSYMYYSDSKIFDMKYSTKMPNGKTSSGVTYIVVPRVLYASSYVSVEVQNGRQIESPGPDMIAVRADARAEKVKIRITPK